MERSDQHQSSPTPRPATARMFVGLVAVRDFPLERRYTKPFDEYEVLKGVSKADEAVLRVRCAPVEQRNVRGPHVPEQRIPIPVGVSGRVFAIQVIAGQLVVGRNEIISAIIGKLG